MSQICLDMNAKKRNPTQHFKAAGILVKKCTLCFHWNKEVVNKWGYKWSKDVRSAKASQCVWQIHWAWVYRRGRPPGWCSPVRVWSRLGASAILERLFRSRFTYSAFRFAGANCPPPLLRKHLLCDMWQPSQPCRCLHSYKKNERTKA